MPSKTLRSLQDRAAAIAARLTELADTEDRSADQTAEINKLAAEADAVKGDIEFEQRLNAKEAELRSIVEPAAPAVDPVVQPEEKPVEIRSLLPHHTELRAFNRRPEDVETAYRLGRWLAASVGRNEDDLRWCKDQGLEVRSLTVGGDTAGIVPPEFSSSILRLVEEYGVFPRVADNMVLAREVMNIPKRTAGISAQFTAESSSISESDPTYTQVQIIAKKLTAATRVSAEMGEDNFVGLMDKIAVEFALSISETIDRVAFTGDGSAAEGGSEFKGLTTLLNEAAHAGGLVSANSGNTSIETLDMDDFLKAVAVLPLYARSGAAWYCSPVTYASAMQRLKYAGGGNTTAEISNGSVDSFLGFPVYLVHAMDGTLGSDPSQIKVLFGNVRQSSIYGRRKEFSVRLYDQVYATTDELLLQGRGRYAMVNHTVGTASEAGPVVALETAAS